MPNKFSYHEIHKNKTTFLKKITITKILKMNIKETKKLNAVYKKQNE